jgi:sugar phosphate permease
MVATIFAPILLVSVIDQFGWKAMLYGCGFLGMFVTMPVLYYFVFDTPRSTPRITPAEITPAEIAYIESGREQDEDLTPNWSFLRRPPFWLAAASGALCNYCIVGVISWLPIYFVEVKGLDFSSLTYAASLPYITGVIAFVVYAFLDDLLNRRALMASFGFFGTALCVYAATIAPTLGLTIAAFSGGTFCTIAFTSQ